MEKIMDISDIKRDNENKYGKYARYKVEVEYLEDKILKKRDDFLDEKQIESDINNFIHGLKKAKREIQKKYLDKRFLYNGIMVLILIGEFFLLTGIGNLLMNLGVSGIITSMFGTFIEVISGVSLVFYVNDGKFYYSKDEMKILEEIKNNLTKSDKILGQIYKMKQEGKLFEYDYERLNKDFEATRERNKERNIDMYNEQKMRSRETDRKIEQGTMEQVKSKGNHSIDNIDIEYFSSDAKKNLQKNSSFREIKQDVHEFISERRSQREQSKYSENSFERGERRRR